MTHTKASQKQAQVFYQEALSILNESGIPFMLGGAFALFHYTGIYRDTKDLDVFLHSKDYPQVLKIFSSKGYTTELHDVRWLVKVFKGDYFIDIIFNSVNNICKVDEHWFKRAQSGQFCGHNVLFIGAEELVWCKSFVWNRERFDGADVNHIFLKYGNKLDWHYLLERMEPHWHLLLAQLTLFRFVYPFDYRRVIPGWLMKELLRRLQEEDDLPTPVERVCLGPIIDNTQYSIDIKKWGYKSFTIKTI